METKIINDMTVVCAVFVMGLLGLVCGIDYEKPRQNLETIPTDIPKDAKEVNLEYNQLTVVPENSFETQGRCRKLFLGSNQISTIDSGAFSGLGRLEQLHLNGNRLTEVRVEMWRGLKALKQLYLQSNSISNLGDGAFSSLMKLEKLELDMNRITALGPGMLRGINNVRTLSVTNNVIKTVEPATFRDVSRDVRTIALGHNAITSLPSDVFSAAQSSRPLKCRLEVTPNPLECGSWACWVVRAEEDGWLYDTGVHTALKQCQYVTNYTQHCTKEHFMPVSGARTNRGAMLVLIPTLFTFFF